MQLRAPAIFLSARHHGENAVIARALTEERGLIAAYVAGARSRRLRAVVIPGNLVALDCRARSENQLPFARLELLESRAPFLSEPLPAAGIAWACALTAASLPERQPYPALYDALGGLLAAICSAPSARGWLPAMNAYEALLLREMGYGSARAAAHSESGDMLAQFERNRAPIAQYLLAGRLGDVMSARQLLKERLGRMMK